MNIIDHVSVGVADIAAARRFYEPVLATLGLDFAGATDRWAAWGREGVQFLAMTPHDGDAASAGNGTHVAFVAPTREAVDAFHRTALDHGGLCDGAPGPRPAYPVPDVHTTFVLDPFGNKLEAIHGGFAN